MPLVISSFGKMGSMEGCERTLYFIPLFTLFASGTSPQNAGAILSRWGLNILPVSKHYLLYGYEKQIKAFWWNARLYINISYQKPSFRSEIYKISYILEPVIDRRSDENEIVGIEFAFEAFALGGLIHLAFAKIDI